jgi:NlpC/P60 family putative phage cell wall peptidase
VDRHALSPWRQRARRRRGLPRPDPRRLARALRRRAGNAARLHADWDETAGEERLWAAARRRLDEIAPSEAAPGDVLLLRMRERGPAKHLGVLASGAEGAPTLIHGYSRRGVVESPLGRAWRRRVVAAFRFPEGAL